MGSMDERLPDGYGRLIDPTWLVASRGVKGVFEVFPKEKQPSRLHPIKRRRWNRRKRAMTLITNRIWLEHTEGRGA